LPLDGGFFPDFTVPPSLYRRSDRRFPCSCLQQDTLVAQPDSPKSTSRVVSLLGLTEDESSGESTTAEVQRVSTGAPVLKKKVRWGAESIRYLRIGPRTLFVNRAPWALSASTKKVSTNSSSGCQPPFLHLDCLRVCISRSRHRRHPLYPVHLHTFHEFLARLEACSC